jgi:2-dehydro-3-deoxygluconokinase
MAKRLLCIGECMVELAPAEGGLFRQGFAGDTFNTAWHARRALPREWEVAYLTCVGTDPVSDAMVSFMDSQGIVTDTVTRLPDATPGLYMIRVENGERSFTYWRGQSAARRLAEDAARLADAIAAADAVFFSGITLAILPPEGRTTLLSLLSGARASGRLVAFDSNLRPRLWENEATMRAVLAEAATAASLALPTWPDEGQLGLDRSPDAVVERYRAAGAREVVVKAGPDPAVVVSDKGTWRIGPARPLAPVDTTGAGDSFNAAYIAARLQGLAEPDAARAAHDLAGRVIMHSGALLPD